MQLMDPIREIRPGANPPEPAFDFDDPQYNINKFYTSCGNSGTPIAVRAPLDAGLYAALTRWLQIKLFPEYRTIQDFVRDAVRHRIEYLQSYHPRAANEQNMWDAVDVYGRHAHLEMRRDRSRENERYVESLREVCQEMLKREDWAELDGVLEDAQDGFDYLPDAYRERVQDIIDKYRPYLTGRTWTKKNKHNDD